MCPAPASRPALLSAALPRAVGVPAVPSMCLCCANLRQVPSPMLPYGFFLLTAQPLPGVLVCAREPPASSVCPCELQAHVVSS